MTWLAIGLSLVSLAVSLWTVWYCRTHWPAGGFVRVPRELRQETIRQAGRSEGLAVDRTIASNREVSGTRVRKGRMRR